MRRVFSVSASIDAILTWWQRYIDLDVGARPGLVQNPRPLPFVSSARPEALIPAQAEPPVKGCRLQAGHGGSKESPLTVLAADPTV